MRKNDWLLFGVLLVAGVGAYLGYRLAPTKPPVRAEIMVEGKVEKTLPLGEYARFEIAGYEGGQNIVEVEGDGARMVWASCPDQLCVRQGRITRPGESLVCLPNRVVVVLDSEGPAENDVDILAE